MLGEELVIIGGDSPSWRAARPLLDAALRLEQDGENYIWYGWNREQMSVFLKHLPALCSLVIGVWEIVPETDSTGEREHLTLGLVCEIAEAEVRSIRTFEALTAVGLKSVEQLEPGIEDALEIMRVVRMQVAPVAWALFTDKVTWNEWLFAVGAGGAVIDKGEVLASFAQQGRCVLLGGRGEIHGHPSHHHS